MSVKDFFKTWDFFFTDIEVIDIMIEGHNRERITFNVHNCWKKIFEEPNHFEHCIIKSFSILNNELFILCVDIFSI